VFYLTPRLVRRALLPASFLVLGAGLVASAAVFFYGRSFDLKAAILSDLESPTENPHGYGVAAAAIVACGVLLAAMVVVFTRYTRMRSPVLALAGGWVSAFGVGAVLAIGALAPFTSGYSPLHIQLAYAAFAGICGGTVLLLAAARANAVVIAAQFVVFLFVVYLYFGPDFMSNDRLLTSLAFWEWMLCCDCGVALWLLARAVERLD
jgi:hypothetical protein